MWAISAVDRPARIGHTTTKRSVTAGCGQLFVLAPTLPDYGHPGQLFLLALTLLDYGHPGQLFVLALTLPDYGHPGQLFLLALTLPDYGHPGQLFVLAPTLPDYGHPGQDGLVFGLVIAVAVSVTVLYHWKFVVVVCINNITVNG